MSKKARASNCVYLSCSESVSELNEALPLLRQANNVKKSCAMLGRIYLRIPNVKKLYDFGNVLMYYAISYYYLLHNSISTQKT